MRIERLAAASDVPVTLAGRLDSDELVRAYRSSDVFVLPSFYEGLPLVTIEALACGCKVVATDLPGVRPWMEAMLPGAPVTWVAPPRMTDVDTPEAADLPLFERALADAIAQALAALPEEDRGIFYRFYDLSQTTAQIADELHMNASTVRSRLLRGREALRKTLTKGGLFCEDDVG